MVRTVRKVVYKKFLKADTLHYVSAFLFKKSKKMLTISLVIATVILIGIFIVFSKKENKHEDYDGDAFYDSLTDEEIDRGTNAIWDELFGKDDDKNSKK